MLIKSKRRVLAAPLDNNATSYHRIIQPLYELSNQGFEVQFLGPKEQQIEQYEWAEILYIQCLYAPDAYKFYADWKAKGKKIILDFDDDYINIPEDSPEQTEIIDKDGNAHSFPPQMRSLYVQMFIQLADTVVVTSDALKSLYSLWNKNIKVIPNCVSEEMQRDIPKTDNDKVRILWSGSSSHLPDLMIVKEPLNNFLEDHPMDVELHIQTSLDEDTVLELFPTAIYHPPVNFADYLNKIQEINADIAIAPLRDHTFNASKSNLKYSQMTLMGAAFVGSNFGPYKEIDHGIDGMLATTPDDWYAYLKQLVEDKRLRETLVKNANKQVAANYMIDKHLHRWAELLIY